MSKSLVGKWKLIKEGSDIMPGIENSLGAPFILKLLGNSENEFFKIEKKKIFDVEEINLSYITRNFSISKSFQLCTLNFEKIGGQDITLSIVQNCADYFDEFTILRLGPRCGQISREIYHLDPSNDQVKLTIEITTGDGTHVNMIRYLERFDHQHPHSEISFKHSFMTLGWNLYEFWPSSILGNCKLAIVKVVKVKTLNSISHNESQVLDTLWKSDMFTEDATIDPTAIPRFYGNKNCEGEDVIEFVIKVSLNETSWYISHRYSEFDYLRKFVLIQNPYNNSFKECDHKFPRKMLGISYRKSALEKRVEGLEYFLLFYLENAKYCRQTTIDAVCSFLKIPENIALAARSRSHDLSSDYKNYSKDYHSKDSLTPSKPHFSLSNDSNTPAHSSEPLTKINANINSDNNEVPQIKPTYLPPVDLATAKRNLFSALEKGIMIVKHGRQGGPKHRVLRCDKDVTKLFWTTDQNKFILTSEILNVRLGTEIDPSTPKTALEEANNPAHDEKKKRLSLFRDKSSTILYGTANLRRHCKPDEMNLCLSLILPERTFDIQCLSKEDYELLKNNLIFFAKNP